VLLAARRSLLASSAGVAITTGPFTARRSLRATAPGTSSTSIVLTRVRTFAPVHSDGVATVTGQVGINRFLAVSAAGRATTTVLLTRYRVIQPAVTHGAATVVVTIGRKRTLTPLSAAVGVGFTLGATTARRSLRASPVGAASTSGTIGVYLGLQHVLWEYHGAQFVFPPEPGLHEVIWSTDDDFVLDPNPSLITVPYQAPAEEAAPA
jgi:hypothetical protein